MATFDSADLLARFRYTIGRPTVDEELSDTEAYRLLSQAQEQVTDELAGHLPTVNYAAPELMTSSDGGYTYTTAHDAIGNMEVLPDLSSTPLRCGMYSDGGADFTQEGPRTIRMTVGRTRTFANGPYARYVRADPEQLSAGVNPVLQPERARILIVYAAAELWALRGGMRDPEPYRRMYLRAAWGDPSGGAVGLIPALKKALYGSGSPAGDAGGAWYPVRT